MRGTSFQELADQIRDMQALREKVHASAFSTLERLAPALVRLLLEDLRMPERAAQWMAMPQRQFGGRNAYQVLADGEVDLIWDCLLGIRPDDAAPAPIRFDAARRGSVRPG